VRPNVDSVFTASFAKARRTHPATFQRLHRKEEGWCRRGGGSLTNGDVPTKGGGTVVGKASGWDLHVTGD
jgi:hypothetical protein